MKVLLPARTPGALGHPRDRADGEGAVDEEEGRVGDRNGVGRRGDEQPEAAPLAHARGDVGDNLHQVQYI